MTFLIKMANELQEMSHALNFGDDLTFFNLGQIMSTCGVNAKMKVDEKFARDVETCVVRHATGDWGDLCDEDKELNNYYLKAENNGSVTGRIFSAYNLEDSKIYIITEWDRSITTVLLSDF